ncbi:hypothetical protein Pmani_033785 [Petrolisthes manimaculis]|uniref:Golgin subfamily A conserved domain-containing protein n=1 Tax=Petrolisthes manimaculis TaxID=1843537 RepID=A0AAE1NQN9_9EUCA|nr:hypothetical protein Pmani_033785 [Petrolisthes manimaculis]
MADFVREQKLAVARKKLRQFQKKKSTRRVTGSSSKEGTPEENVLEDSTLLSESGTLSSRASSTDLASEEFVELAAEPIVETDGQTHITLGNGRTEVKETVYDSQHNSSSYLTRQQQAGSYMASSPGQVHGNIGGGQNELHTSQECTDSFDVQITPAIPSNTHQVDVMQHQSSTSFPFQPGLSINYMNHIDHTAQEPLAEPECVSNVPAQEETVGAESVTQATIIHPAEREIPTTIKNIVVPSVTVPVTLSDAKLLENNMLSGTGVSQTTFDAGLLENNITTSTIGVVETCGEVHENNVVLNSSVPESSSDYGQPDPTDGGEGGEAGSVSSETTASVTTAIHVAGSDTHTGLKSSSESLRQISLQLSGLMNDSGTSAPVTMDSTVSELERRNSELAALLLQETQQSQQQAQQIVHLKSQLERMEAELSGAHAMLNPARVGGGAREVESLREQLQVHIQTIGILVAEKSELQSSLTHATHSLNQKAGQVTELEGRLDAARHRASNAEAEARDSTTQLQAARDSLATLTKELDTTRTTGFKNSKQCEDLKTSVSELSERLRAKTKEYDSLLTQLTETKGQLAMAELHIQQLRDGNQDESKQTQLIQAQSQQAETQRQLEETRAALTKTQTENKQVAAHYQQYTAQLVSQLQGLQDMVTKLTEEKTRLTLALEASQAQAAAAAAAAGEGEGQGAGEVVSQAEMEAERQSLQNTITDLQQLTLQLKEQNAAMTNDNSQLSRLVEQLSRQVEELEVELERNKTEEVDTGKLLEAMQSDKVAAARALTQNRQLKEQLEELQSGFIIMSNKKLELTEKLEKELHTKKGLNQEIGKLEEILAALRQQQLEKEREFVMLKENSHSLGKQLFLARNQNQQEEHQNRVVQGLTQDIATYAEQVQELEQKLKLSRTDIENLSCQNTELRNIISSHDLQLPDSSTLLLEDSGQERKEEDNDGKIDLVSKVGVLSASVSQLEEERNNLLTQLEEERAKNAKSKPESHQTNTTPESNATGVNEGAGMEQLLKLQEAHNALEKRFSRSMEQVAVLSDEKQQLEHVVQQLQLETDTIGDYITIYQFQRGVMKQQARERELELASLRHEREEMKDKLANLQDLMAVLGQEKDADWERLGKMTKIIQSPVTVANGLENGSSETEGEESQKDTEDETEESDEGKEKGSTACGGMTGGTTDNTNSHNHHHHHHHHEHQQQKEVVEGGEGDKGGGTKSPTVQRILDLLNEMEASSQLEHSGLQKFHPCPLCSGKLITV